MPDEICILFGEDGKAHAYNSEFDVTIHCENEHEMNEAVALLNLANRLHWRNTDVTPPTEEDCDRYGNVLCWYAAAKHAGPSRWDNVVLCPVDLPYWMPMPEPPEVEK